MIITCPWCEKKFEVDKNLIPDKGRLLKCGSCDQTWFFNKKSLNKDDLTKNNESVSIKINPSKKEINYIKKSSKENKKNSKSEMIKYEPKSFFNLSTFLSYILVIIISFIALIIILDTFKNPLYNYLPKLEFFLFSLFETLKDIELFIKDLL